MEKFCQEIFMLTVSNSCFSVPPFSNHHQSLSWSCLDHILPLCWDVKLFLLSLLISQLLRGTWHFVITSGTLDSPGCFIFLLSSSLDWPSFLTPCKHVNVLWSSSSSCSNTSPEWVHPVPELLHKLMILRVTYLPPNSPWSLDSYKVSNYLLIFPPDFNRCLTYIGLTYIGL